MQPVKNAQLRWQAGVPVSTQFEDIYFNQTGGAAETQHVFIEGNQLPQRFASLSAGEHFVIAETGFGTGLNFLVTRQQWLKQANPQATLHFISFEKYPLSRQDIRHIWQDWSELNDCQEAFLSQYPAPMEGFYTLFFDQERIQLTLVLGDLLEQISQLKARVDAWFLDGFAPAKNPEMWHPRLFQGMADCSHDSTTLATFTVARSVREGLQQAGFQLSKQPGFGRKREMLCGEYATLSAQQSFPRPQQVIVVGAGLAGASTARMLAEAGVAVTLLEREAEPAQQGSGNAQGALYAKLAVKPTPHSAFHLQGLGYSVNQLRQLPAHASDLASLCGVLQLAISERDQQRHQQIETSGLYPESLLQPVNAETASTLAGSKIPHSGLFFPDAGWVAPADYCRYLLQHPLISCHYQQTVQQLDQAADAHWTVSTTTHTFQATHVVICTAADARQLTPLQHLPLKPIRGQTSLIQAGDTLPQLKTVVCGEGYISPPRRGKYCFGATFDLHQTDLALRDADHQQNLDTLAAALPEFEGLTPAQCNGRTGYRCSTPDYLPLVGAIADYNETLQRFAGLRTDARRASGLEIPRVSGLYVNTGHGSKGLISCPISAALITAMLCDLPAPLPAELIERLDPGRFILRDLSRRRI
ncbi:tRNA (5-methylaminomethyl-2-thiouridylate)-methyltransferase [Nitrincola lacisaponensis]|uniref:tRNA 5-methylaminomethyl-2-thiouridine biosynthesis bifunctional protein MnmC n=1 Tax=Nitrincola lacisaponensis TaxID=267850 RepID=A0A063Y637_9GAMM|nr:bifunctional tRNA (5-methylaminomethyl-2-thiouridine)(34)-methyltransferase MnmD/FAD-dependent 5-carboxymethylaminomethyl-2-thiouridine(34) oxidoreductase MnmC [Nitrincola lacisaponensis]KDE40605.1 tRNA (5-methylaminomethyl-2-thiouridylate)-methyltransferase [Nitrincola lacisaponensis]